MNIATSDITSANRSSYNAGDTYVGTLLWFGIGGRNLGFISVLGHPKDTVLIHRRQLEDVGIDPQLMQPGVRIRFVAKVGRKGASAASPELVEVEEGDASAASPEPVGTWLKGTVCYFPVDGSVFGFIRPDDGSQDIYLHISAVRASRVDPYKIYQGVRVRCTVRRLKPQAGRKREVDKIELIK